MNINYRNQRAEVKLCPNFGVTSYSWNNRKYFWTI